MSTDHRNPRPRLANGQLIALVIAHLRANPDLDFSAPEVAKALGRSHGTVYRILLGLAEAGTVIRTQQDPARFRIAP